MIRYLIEGINRLTENLNKANQRMGAHVMNLMSEESEKAIICLNAYLDENCETTKKLNEGIKVLEKLVKEIDLINQDSE